MKQCLFSFVLASALFSASCQAINTDPSTAKIKSLYNSLPKDSISEHLAFYELYGSYREGQMALQEAYLLLSGEKQLHDPAALATHLPNLSGSIDALIALINKQSAEELLLSESQIAFIETLASRLPNRRLLGHSVTSEEEVLKLTSDQIDLARGLLLSQLKDDHQAMSKIKSYEAALDLMALQILTRISLQSTPEEKVKAINHFVFHEMGFRFPPHSTHAKDIDLYTFLPSVLDSRRGVCLGVSILYLCLAERLDLKLEIVIPPGHIFVRAHEGDKMINIETTARGVHLPDEKYLGVDLRKLPLCNKKETIGMAHFNQASVFWKTGEYNKVLASYQRAKPYLPDNQLMKGFMGLASILQGDQVEGKALLAEIKNYLPDHAVSKDTMAEDYLDGKVDAEGIKAFFLNVDESRASLLQKKQALEDTLKKYPRFREGLFSLASTWMQLHRTKEALKTLRTYHAIDPTNPSVEYYLAVLFAERLDYNKAWEHLQIAEKLTRERDHTPKSLINFRQELSKICPE